MAISMYDLSVAVFSHMLANLSGILDKGAAYAAQKKFDPQVLVNARLAGVEVPKREDDEATLDQLKARIAWTGAFIGSILR